MPGGRFLRLCCTVLYINELRKCVDVFSLQGTTKHSTQFHQQANLHSTSHVPIWCELYYVTAMFLAVHRKEGDGINVCPWMCLFVY